MPFKDLFKKFKNKTPDSQYPEDALSSLEMDTLNNEFTEKIQQCKNSPQRTYDLCRDLSEKGSTLALYHLGHFYEQGDGQKQYPEQAAECYWRAS